MRLIVCFFLMVSTASQAQLTQVQQKAFNNFIDYANQSADEVTAVVKSIQQYYPTLYQQRAMVQPRYTCPVQQNDYYLNLAIQESKALPVATSTILLEKLKTVREAAEKIDATCKALDTYHKLQDYKQDNFEKAYLLIGEIEVLVKRYQQNQQALNQTIEKLFYAAAAYSESHVYYKTDMLMRKHIAQEKLLLDAWTFNIKEEVHTGWPVDKLKNSIAESAIQADVFAAYNPVLKYPTSSMYTSFKTSLSDMLRTKRAGLDGNNFEAQKTDKHSNDAYMNLINYYNGALVSNYNTFIQFARGDGYQGLKAIKYVPAFEVRTQPVSVMVSVSPFIDIQHTPIHGQPKRQLFQKMLSKP